MPWKKASINFKLNLINNPYKIKTIVVPTVVKTFIFSWSANELRRNLEKKIYTRLMMGHKDGKHHTSDNSPVFCS